MQHKGSARAKTLAERSSIAVRQCRP